MDIYTNRQSRFPRKGIFDLYKLKHKNSNWDESVKKVKK